MSFIIPCYPPDYKTLSVGISNLKCSYPFLRTGILGRSLCLRKIYSLRLGRAENPVLITAGFHAQEWITSLVLLRFIERVCQAAQKRNTLCGIDVGGALNRREVIFIPCINPDGTEIALKGSCTAGKYRNFVEKISNKDLSHWNANARGVDINHNFNAGWQISRKLENEAGITGPSPRRFGGAAPESEPETQALTNLCRNRCPRTAIALHSQGEEIFYEYGKYTPERGLHLAKIFSASSGYTLVQNAGIYSHAGFKDWFIEEFHSPAFTFELGKGKNPLPLSEFDSIYSKVEEMLILACIM
ncbi:MAG: M14 family metallocarboxypeptidase [Clostridia bacterium]|nr:M14 family metallocarboxypeptidase [Clostridia bacterium]